ncbi:MAG: InlB B-repeat-containing protein [Agathobacter sp.]|nr:InlB B-repeat-containing protein [Agathobacter sp.]
MNQRTIMRRIITCFMCIFVIWSIMSFPTIALASGYEKPAEYIYWNDLKSNIKSLLDETEYYKLDLSTYGLNLSISGYYGNTYDVMRCYDASRVTYQRLFQVSCNTTISLVDGSENQLNTNSIAWAVLEWDVNGNILFDSNWMNPSQSYTAGVSTNGIDYSLGTRSTKLNYITIVFRYIEGGDYSDGVVSPDMTPEALASYFPNLYICYQPFTYTICNEDYTNTVNRLGIEEIPPLSNPSKRGYTFSGWKVTSNSALMPNWMNGNTYTTEQLNTYMSEGKFYNSLFGNVTFTAQYVPNDYTVFYDANGGRTDATAKTVPYGESVSLTPSASKAGCTFVGWSTSSTSRLPLSSFFMPDTNVTLYAIYTREVSDVENHDYPDYTASESDSSDEVYLLVWIRNNSSVYQYYPLTYKYDTNTMVYKYELSSTDIVSFTNGREFCYQLIAFDNAGNYAVLVDGSNGTPPPMPPVEYLQTVKHYKQEANTGEWIQFDTTNAMALSGTCFTPDYVTAPMGYSVSSKDAGEIVAGPKVYHAYYKPNTYTISFHANGGNCSLTERLIVYTAYYGELPVPIRKGYTFLGWNTALNGSGTRISSGDIYEVVGNQTLYAQWKENVYTINLDDQEAVTPGTVAYYEKYNVGNYTSADCTTTITSIAKPEKKGYTFQGYYTGKDGNGAQYVKASGEIASTNTTFSSDEILYAYWTANTYSVQYNANGGSGTMTNTPAIYDEEVTLSANTFERIGYTFVGWSTTANGTLKYEDNDSVKNLTLGDGDIVNLYAVWKANSYHVTYDYETNGGTKVSEDSKVMHYGESIDLTVTAEKDGYTFVGWNTVPDAMTKLNSLTMETNHVILYAIFEKTITVSFRENDDTGPMTTTMSETIYNNDQYAEFLISEKTNWTGWKNIGWTDQISATEDAMIFTGATFTTDKSTILYALYASEVTVSYDTNGSTVEYDSQTKERFYNASGDYFDPIFKIAKAPVLLSYSFDKWIAEDGSEYTADIEAEIEKDMLLTARWDKYPELLVSNRYFTLEEANDGKITQAELLKKVVATDREDGTLVNGIDVIIKNYSATTFTSIEEDAEVEISYQAIDSFGNEVTKSITVFITDTAMKKSTKKTYVRFISNEFWVDKEGILIATDKGGLEETSVWRINPEYRSLLQSALSCKNKQTESYFFTSQDIKWIKEYTNTYGSALNAVEEFLDFLLIKIVQK